MGLDSIDFELTGSDQLRICHSKNPQYTSLPELITPAKISPATLAKLAKLGIHHRSDLLLHLPLRYEDETHLAPIATVQAGETAQVQGVIAHSEVTFRPPHVGVPPAGSLRLTICTIVCTM